MHIEVYHDSENGTTHITSDNICDELSHAICMGIRHGLRGSKAGSNEDVCVPINRELALIAEALGSVAGAIVASIK